MNVICCIYLLCVCVCVFIVYVRVFVCELNAPRKWIKRPRESNGFWAIKMFYSLFIMRVSYGARIYSTNTPRFVTRLKCFIFARPSICAIPATVHKKKIAIIHGERCHFFPSININWNNNNTRNTKSGTFYSFLFSFFYFNSLLSLLFYFSIFNVIAVTLFAIAAQE